MHTPVINTEHTYVSKNKASAMLTDVSLSLRCAMRGFATPRGSTKEKKIIGRVNDEAGEQKRARELNHSFLHSRLIFVTVQKERAREFVAGRGEVTSIIRRRVYFRTWFVQRYLSF